jgi:hypothetical protein
MTNVSKILALVKYLVSVAYFWLGSGESHPSPVRNPGPARALTGRPSDPTTGRLEEDSGTARRCAKKCARKSNRPRWPHETEGSSR